MNSKLAAIVLATVALALGTACGEEDNAPAVASPLAIYAGEWNGDDALIEGELTLEGNCLYVGDEPFRRLVAFASEGTAWDEETETVQIPGATLTVGESVSLGGSQATDTRVDWIRPPASECDQSQVWLSGRG